MNETLRRFTLFFAIAGTVATLALAFAVGARSLSVMGFGIWAASPFVAVALLCRRPRASQGAALTLFLATLLLAAFAFPIYIQGFFVKPDAQGGLLFIFIPVWQWAGLVPAFLLAAVLESRALRSPS